MKQEIVDGKKHYCWVFGTDEVRRVDVRGQAYGKPIKMGSMAAALRLCQEGGEVKRVRGWA
jgi:hypothetical protein